MPNPGEIFIFKNYRFDDGSYRDKWFIVLNSPDLEKPCLVLITTSKSNRYTGCVKGCNKHLRCFFAPTAWQACFKVDTYIQLPKIFEFPLSDLLKDGLSGRIEQIPSPLTHDCSSQLLSCLTGYKDDISQFHWDLIYKHK